MSNIQKTVLSKIDTFNEKHKQNKMKYQKLNYQYNKKEAIRLFVESNYYKIYSTFLTIFALYIDDIKKLTTEKDYDKLFDIIIIIIISLFLLELILYFFLDEKYGCGLFFWIDIISIISMILEISNISEKIIYYDSSGVQQVKTNRMSIMKISKSLKIIRIVKMTKLIKLLNHFFKRKKK